MHIAVWRQRVNQRIILYPNKIVASFYAKTRRETLAALFVWLPPFEWMVSKLWWIHTRPGMRTKCPHRLSLLKFKLWKCTKGVTFIPQRRISTRHIVLYVLSSVAKLISKLNRVVSRFCRYVGAILLFKEINTLKSNATAKGCAGCYIVSVCVDD